MQANINEELKIYSEIPKFWNGINGYHYKSEQEHYNDGWRSVITPEISETEKLGQLIYDETEDVVTYEVLNKTAEEIQTENLNKFNSRKSIAVEKLISAEVIETAQTFEDRNKQAEFAEVYPMWDDFEDGSLITAGTLINFQHENGEIKLYEVMADVWKQENSAPDVNPNSFDEFKHYEGYQVWRQPHAHNPYMEGDIVWFPNGGDSLYISLVDTNVYSPDVAPQNWELYEQ